MKTTPSTYTVTATTEVAAYRNNTNTIDGWEGSQPILAEELPKMVEDCDGFDFEWTSPTTAVASFPWDGDVDPEDDDDGTPRIEVVSFILEEVTDEDEDEDEDDEDAADDISFESALGMAEDFAHELNLFLRGLAWEKAWQHWEIETTMPELVEGRVNGDPTYYLAGSLFDCLPYNRLAWIPQEWEEDEIENPEVARRQPFLVATLDPKGYFGYFAEAGWVVEVFGTFDLSIPLRERICIKATLGGFALEVRPGLLASKERIEAFVKTVALMS